MKKKILSVLLCTAMLVTMTGCGTKESATVKTQTKTETNKNSKSDTDSNDPITLVYAEVNPLDTIVGQTGQKFKETVEELSNGEIIIDLQTDGVLGTENDILDSMLGGGSSVDMIRISAFGLTSYGGEKSMLLSLPYTFVSREHFWNFATSDLAEEFLLEPQENGSGVRGLFYGEEGFRHFFTAKEVTGIDDFKGMKIRVANDAIMNSLVEALGATPTVVALNDLYSALQTGVCDAAEQPIANYKANAFPEVANTMILDGHTLGAVQVIITDAAWNKLTEEQQDILVEAGKVASEYNRQISEEAENEVLEELKASGCNIVEVDDVTPWQEATKALIEEYTKDNKDLYQQILDMQ